jgi:hypothetical protein
MKPASGRKRESAVWRHYDYDAVSDKSQCKKCQNKISGKNSTNMKRHLETAHKEDFEKVVAECEIQSRLTTEAGFFEAEQQIYLSTRY